MKLLIVGGKTGGHLCPALALAEHWHSEEAQEVTVLVPEHLAPNLKAWLLMMPFAALEIPVFTWRRLFSPAFFYEGSQLIRACLQIQRALKVEKPQAVLVFGTWIGFLTALFAKLKRIPVVVHEQNRVPGKANYYVRFFADGIAESIHERFEESKKDRFLVTGLPIRKNLIEMAMKKHEAGDTTLLHFKTDRLQILILGGSQGAHALNQMLIQILSRFSDVEKEKFAVIHIMGMDDFRQYKNAYDDCGIESQVMGFSDEMEQLYAVADIVISRAGGGVLAELALFGLPSILVPYPYAASHQLQNAEFYAQRGSTFIIAQGDVEEKMPDMLRVLISNPELRSKMGQAMRRCSYPEASYNLSSLVKTICGKTK